MLHCGYKRWLKSRFGEMLSLFIYFLWEAQESIENAKIKLWRTSCWNVPGRLIRTSPDLLYECPESKCYGESLALRPPWTPTTNNFFWCLFCILGYSKHFIFSWKFSFFLVGIGWDWGILGSNNLMNWWDINPPFMYCVFHHISDHLQRLILFWQFYKKVGLRSDPPPPWLVQKTKFVKGNISGAPLSHWC